MQRKPKGPGLSEELSRRRLLQLGAAGAALLGAGRASAAPAGSPDAGTGQGRFAGRGRSRRAPGADGERRGDQPLHHPEVPGPDRPAGRPPPLGARDQPGRAGPGRRAGPGAEGREAARPAARHPGAAQGQHRHQGPDAHHRRLAGADGRDRPRGRVPGGTPPRGRGGAAREDAAQRVGQLPLHALVERLERAWWAVPQRVRAGPEPLGVELGVRRRGVGEPLRGRGGHRDRRVHRLALGGLGAGGREADGGPGEPGRHRPHLPQPGHRRPDGTDGPRRRAAAGGARGARPGRRRDRRQGAAVRRPLLGGARPWRAEGRTHRRGPDRSTSATTRRPTPWPRRRSRSSRPRGR